MHNEKRVTVRPMYKSGQLCLWLLVGILVNLLALENRAIADLTVVSQVNVGGLPAASDSSVPTPVFPITYKTYFQGDSIRSEDSDGNVYIFDNNSGTVYQLFAKTKTYRSGSIKSVEDIRSVFPEDQRKFLTVDSSLYFGTSVDTQNYLSVSATRLPITGDAALTMNWTPLVADDPHKDRPQQPIHAAAPDQTKVQGIHKKLPSYHIDGSVWVAPSMMLPKSKKETQFPIAMQMIFDGPTFISDLASEIDQSRELPLHADVTIKETFGDDSTGGGSNTITTTFDVVSVDHLSIDPSLFSVPVDYTKDSLPVSLPQIQAPDSEPDSQAK